MIEESLDITSVCYLGNKELPDLKQIKLTDDLIIGFSTKRFSFQRC